MTNVVNYSQEIRYRSLELGSWGPRYL